MEAMLGFRLDFWDYITFAAISVMVFAALGLAVFVLGLPGRIAIARNHPEADAVWVGFVAVVPWIQALIIHRATGSIRYRSDRVTSWPLVLRWPDWGP